MSDRLSIRYAKALGAWCILKLWPGALPKWMFWILPSCGDYAYWDEPAFVEQRRKPATAASPSHGKEEG